MNTCMVKLQGCGPARMLYWTSVLFSLCNYGKINRVWTEIGLTAVIGGIFMNCVSFSLDCSAVFFNPSSALLASLLKPVWDTEGQFGSDPRLHVQD